KSPSTPGSISTNAPNVTIRLTVPVISSPFFTRSSTLSQGPGSVFLYDNEMRSLSKSTDKISTSMTSSTDNTSDTLSTCVCDNSDMCTNPSTPPISTNAPKLVIL